MKKLGAERLLILASHLYDNVLPAYFYYLKWVGEDWKGAPDLSCGTTACALGHAATMPQFQALGLRLARERGTHDGYVTLDRLPQADPHSGNLCSMQAAREIFLLSGLEAEYLFAPGESHPDDDVDRPSPGADASAQEVAEHIRAYVYECFPELRPPSNLQKCTHHYCSRLAMASAAPKRKNRAYCHQHRLRPFYVWEIIDGAQDYMRFLCREHEAFRRQLTMSGIASEKVLGKGA